MLLPGHFTGYYLGPFFLHSPYLNTTFPHFYFHSALWASCHSCFLCHSLGSLHSTQPSLWKGLTLAEGSMGGLIVKPLRGTS